MNKKQAFELWQEWKNASLTPRLIADIESEWLKTIVQMHKTLIGRSQKDATKAFDALRKKGFENDLIEAKKPFEERVSQRLKEFRTSQDKKENQLRQFSKNYSIESCNEMIKVKVSFGHSYMSQGWGACKYARENLTNDKLLLELLGHNVEIKEVNGHQTGGRYSQYIADYELWANISEFDYEMMKMGYFISVLNWAVLCWQRGTNPKVYFPFLSNDDYEKSQLLAYHTNYKITRENMEQELSWEEIENIRI